MNARVHVMRFLPELIGNERYSRYWGTTHAHCSTLKARASACSRVAPRPVDHLACTRTRLAEYNPQLSLGPPSLLYYYEQGHSLAAFTRTTGKTGFVQLVIGFIFEFHVRISRRCAEKTIFCVRSVQERTTQGCRH